MFIASPLLEILSQIESKSNWLPMTPFLVYMYGMRLTFGKPLIRKQYTSWPFLIISAKSVKVPIKLSEDCYCNLSVPIPNEHTLVVEK